MPPFDGGWKLHAAAVPDYAVTFARSARKELAALPARLGDRIFRVIERLEQDPRPEGCRKIQGSSGLWRVRVGDYRVVYSVTDRTRKLDVIAVRHRRDAYR